MKNGGKLNQANRVLKRKHKYKPKKRTGGELFDYVSFIHCKSGYKEQMNNKYEQKITPHTVNETSNAWMYKVRAMFQQIVEITLFLHRYFFGKPAFGRAINKHAMQFSKY